MTATRKTLSVLDRCAVAPAGDTADQRLPITFFDVIWLYFHPIQRLLFYQHPCSAAHFRETIIPNIKKSLSQTLRHYLPAAGNLFYPLGSSIPELRYSSGDSVTVTFAESTETTNFGYLIGDQPRDADQFHSFVPELPEPKTDTHYKVLPLLAIQVTHFPDTGIAVGVTNHHVLGDASSIVGFIKAWSSIAKVGGEDEHLIQNDALPIFDRSLLKDPSNLLSLYWNQMRETRIGESQPTTPTNKVRATFVLQKKDVARLKELVLNSEIGSWIHLSSFTVAIAYFWTCMDRAVAEAGEGISDDDEEFFGFAVDARSRISPPLPAAYFGNCLGFVVAKARHGAIKEKDGFLRAAELVGGLIRDKVNKKGALLSDADEWLTKYGMLMGKRCFGVAGSPKFDIYGADFGWGSPVKFEAVSIDGDANPSVALCKSREFEGGLEMGVSLPEKTMDAFAAAFYHGLDI